MSKHFFFFFWRYRLLNDLRFTSLEKRESALVPLVQEGSQPNTISVEYIGLTALVCGFS